MKAAAAVINMTLATALATTLLLGAHVALAGEVELTGAEEVPAVTTSATGTGNITVKADKSVSGSVKTKGVKGVAAHIHLAPAGKNGPPIITLVKSGEDTWLVPEGSKLTDEQLASYKAGDLYINIHSPEHKSGEIRAQLKP